MLPSAKRRTYLLPILLSVAAGCQETTTPFDIGLPQFAQGVNGVWTVNTLADTGDGICDDAACTLREAIAAAASGDQIVFLASLQGAIDLAGGSLSNLNKSLTIDGATRITINAHGASRVLEISSNPFSTHAVVTLKGLQLTNGFVSAGDGAGIRFFSGSLTLDGVTVTNGNTLVNGGGIWVGSDAALTVRNSVITNNTAQGDGGGIHSAGAVTISNSTINGNTAADEGGAINSLAGGRLTVQNSSIADNTATIGAGIWNDAGSTTVVNGSTLSNNQAAITAAGIHNAGTATFVLSTVSGNRLTGTLAGTGGLRNLGALQVRSSTITLNSGNGVGGIFAGGATTVENSIVAGNTSSSTATNNCDGATSILVSAGHNITVQNTGCDLFATGDIHVVAAQVFTGVIEQQLKNNGGPTATHALIVRGRAVDAGYCPGETVDQRGFTRPVDDAAMPNAVDACDIGAYELQGPFVPLADLIISQSVDKTSVKQGEQITYTIRVQNLGPLTAPNVVVTNTLSSGVTFVDAMLTKGTHTAPPKGETGVVTWSIGEMLNQANEVAEIKVTVLVRGKTTVTNTASVTGSVVDPNTANNTAAITVSVAAGGSGNGGNRR